MEALRNRPADSSAGADCLAKPSGALQALMGLRDRARTLDTLREGQQPCAAVQKRINQPAEPASHSWGLSLAANDSQPGLVPQCESGSANNGGGHLALARLPE